VKQWQKNVAWFSALIAVTVALSVLAFSFDPNSGADAAPTQSDGADSGFEEVSPLT
jgi:hypothetical protein